LLEADHQQVKFEKYQKCPLAPCITSFLNFEVPFLSLRYVWVLANYCWENAWEAILFHCAAIRLQNQLFYVNPIFHINSVDSN
ncbi:hypothetical protein ACQP3D_27305, partial [Escherichia coli]